MKLYYITRVDISTTAAQALQINSMCKVFSEKINNFKLISTSPKNNISVDFAWDRLETTTKFIYLEVIIRSLMIVYRDMPTHVFTRDIAIAFVLSFFKISVTYEAHKEPIGKIACVLAYNLCKKRNFKIIAISQALSNYYIKNFHIDQKLILTAHDGVFIDKYDQLRGIPSKLIRIELDLPLDKTIVLHTGSLYKGNDAKLFKNVISNFKDILFVQVGGTSKDIDRYKVYYQRFDNILFVPHQSVDVVKKYQLSSDLLFYALTKENNLWWCTSPLKIFEYMATNVPMMASNIGSVTEILNNNNSILFDPENESTIIDAINFFLSKKSIAKSKANIALNEVRKKYTWSQRVENIINFLK